MKRHTLAAACATLVASAATTAHAGMIVHDPTSYAKLIAQAETALKQLQELKAQVEQGRQLFGSLNTASGVNALAPELSSPGLRSAVPEATDVYAAGQGQLRGLGAVGARAAEIRAAARVYTPAQPDEQSRELEAAGVRAARDLAVSEAISGASTARLRGLQQLQRSIGEAGSARAVLDLQARLTAEQTMIANDQMRLQAIAMAQAAEERMEQQRERERARAASAKRMAIYRNTYQ